MAFGGVGGRRIFGLTPEPAPWSAWADTVRDHRGVRGFPIEYVGVNGGAGDSLAQRAEPLPPSGEIKIYSSGGGARAPLSPPMSSPQDAKKYESASVWAEV